MKSFETRPERGTMILVVMFIAAAIAALAAIHSGRLVTETRTQKVLEDETRAINDAYAQIHMAMNVVANSAYDEGTRNLAIRHAVRGDFGGTAGGEPPDGAGWLVDPEGIEHGMIEGTETRVYRARDYVLRLQKLRGDALAVVDPFGDSDRYFVLEAAGRADDVVRLVSALVRENEPFSSFVFFQNRHDLGVSGSPRGLIHSNAGVDFYFPDGNFVDSVSAVNGFDYESGATVDNTTIMDGNDSAAPIELEGVDFEQLKAEANLYVGEPGHDAEILLLPDGHARITPVTPPRWDLVEIEYTQSEIVGFTEETLLEMQPVQIGTMEELRTRSVVCHYVTEEYTVEVPVYETRQEEYTVTIPIYEDQEVVHVNNVPVWTTHTVTRTRWVRVFVPYDDGAGGGTAIGGNGGVPGEYVWVEEEYQIEEEIIDHYEEQTYTTIEPVQVGETTEPRTRDVQVQIDTVEETREHEVPVYMEEEYTVEVPVFENREVEITYTYPVYGDIPYVREEWQYQPPTALAPVTVNVKQNPGVIFIEGRILGIQGDLQGRLTIVGTERGRITGSLRYVDESGETPMLHGGDRTQPYERNPEYHGDSTLGVITRDDLVFTANMPDQAEINATLMSVEGRVGADGLWVTEEGEVLRDSSAARNLVLSPEEREREQAYDDSGVYRMKRFVKESLRRMGGIISNDRIVETYIRPRNDGTAYVAAGFKRGTMRFDLSLLFNPPPSFVEVPRPVVTHFAPVFMTRDDL